MGYNKVVVKMSLNGKDIKGVLLDITGVLVESTTGGSKAIPGSIEAVKKLSAAGIPVRFVTNETQRTRASLVKMLHENGYSMPEADVFPPALAMAAIIKEKSLRPFTLVHPNLSTDLPGVPTSFGPLSKKSLIRENTLTSI